MDVQKEQKSEESTPEEKQVEQMSEDSPPEEIQEEQKSEESPPEVKKNIKPKVIIAPPALFGPPPPPYKREISKTLFPDSGFKLPEKPKYSMGPPWGKFPIMVPWGEWETGSERLERLKKKKKTENSQSS